MRNINHKDKLQLINIRGNQALSRKLCTHKHVIHDEIYINWKK